MIHVYKYISRTLYFTVAIYTIRQSKNIHSKRPTIMLAHMTLWSIRINSKYGACESGYKYLRYLQRDFNCDKVLNAETGMLFRCND